MNEFKNILIVRTDRIGDVVLTVPAIRAIRKKFPDARLTVLLSPLTVDLLDGLSLIDEILVDERRGMHQGFWGFLQLIRQLRQKKFDLAVIYHTKKRTNLACFLANIPYRLGYKNNKHGGLLNHPVEDVRPVGNKHEAQYCLDLLDNIGIQSNDLTLEIAKQESSNRWIVDFLKSRGIDSCEGMIVLHPAASDPAKQWPKESFAELVNEMHRQKQTLKFVIIGTKENRSLARDIQNKTDVEILDITGMLSLSQLVSLLARTAILISNDSGPVHIAAALGIPVVSIFTRNQPGINPQRWQPLGKNGRVVSVPINDRVSFKKAREYDPKSMDSIPVSQVLEAVDSLFKLC